MKRIAILLLILCACSSLQAQYTPVLSQYMVNGLPLNPAFTGSRDAMTVQLGFRRQWAGLEGAPKTETVSIHAPMKQDKFAVGLLIFNDRIGVSRRSGMMVNAAYRLHLRKGVLSFGLAGGMVQHRHRWSDVVTGTTNDQVFQSDQMTMRPEFSAGVYYYTQTFYASLSSPMFLQNIAPPANINEGVDFINPPKNVNLMLNTGVRFAVSNGVTLTPSIMLKNYGSYIQTDFNLMAMYNQRLEAGFSYRTQTAIVAIARFRATDQIAIGYSYDLPAGAASAIRAGGHEVTLSYDFRYKNYTANPRFF